jgi:ectoine hydroxylase-related dioxygenase (phytanoyl-CoA dioxygenase family)
MDGYVAEYLRSGYVVVPGFLDPAETERLRAVTDALEARAEGVETEDALFDFEPGPTSGRPRIQRIKKPHRADPYFFELAAHPRIVAFLSEVIGPDLRLSHSKINMKAAQDGSPLEWHQDWAFAPHTNMSTCVASVMIDDCDLDNGAMQVIPGSHQGPLYDHHGADGFFEGAISPATPGLDFTKAAPLVGAAGSVTFHHPLTIHGSGFNRSDRSRRILFLEYAATDAFPLFYSVDWTEYGSRIVAGPPTPAVRSEPNPIKLPFPTRAGSSIYKIQAGVESRFFAR